MSREVSDVQSRRRNSTWCWANGGDADDEALSCGWGNGDHEDDLVEAAVSSA